MPLPTSPVVADLRPDRLRAAIMGTPGAGKTTFAAGWFQKTNLLIDLEGGTRFLGGEHFVEKVESYSGFSQIVNELVAGGHPFTTVTIDTGSALVQLADAESAARHGKISSASVEFGKGIGDRDGVIYRDLTKLLTSDLGVLFICHSMLLNDEDAGMNTVVPALPTGSSGKPGIREFVVGRFDNVWCARRNGPSREIVLQPTAKYSECKSRVPMPETLPLDPRAVYEAVKAGCGTLAPAKTAA